MRKKRVEKENGERWLLTYSDLITLLMIFFVMMYAMSSVDTKKYAQVAASLSSAFGGAQAGKSIIAEGGPSSNIIPTVDNPTMDAEATKAEQSKLEALKKQVDKYLQNNGIQSSASTTIQERGLVISISDTLIFDSGKADLKPIYESKLVEIGKMLNTINNYIVIEGNTDDVPINTYEFKDNWSLASARADNVTRVLIDKAKIQPLKIASRSNGQYRPVVSNSTDDGKAANRRVDIVILDNKYSSTENNQTK
jgi:chemotaxis protein MotB